MSAALRRKVGGFLLVLLGAVLLVTPGPGLPLLVIGLRMLGVGSGSLS